MKQETVVRICRAFQPGDVVFVECGRSLGPAQREDMARAFGSLLKDSGVRVVVLEGGMRLAARTERSTASELCPNCDHHKAQHVGGEGECMDLNCSCSGCGT